MCLLILAKNVAYETSSATNVSIEGQQTFNQYAHALQQREDLTIVTIRNYLGNLRQFMARCVYCFREEQNEPSLAPQIVAKSLLIHYRIFLPTMGWLKPSTVNRTLMSLKRYFVWAAKTQIIQQNSSSCIEFVPKEVSAPRHLSKNEKDVLVTAAYINSTLRNETIIVLLLHTGLHTQELCTRTRPQVCLGKRSRTLPIKVKRKKVREGPLNATARFILSKYLATISQECFYFLPSKKYRKCSVEPGWNYNKLRRFLDMNRTRGERLKRHQRNYILALDHLLDAGNN